jgi:hypothetical protein
VQLKSLLSTIRRLTATLRWCLPYVTIQVLPAVAHPATQSGFMVTDSAAYAEHVIGGLAYTEPETVTVLERLFDSLRDEWLPRIRVAGDHQEGQESYGLANVQLLRCQRRSVRRSRV